MLGCEILRAVLADDADAGIDERAELVDRQILRRDDDRHAVAHLFPHTLVALAGLLR